MAKTTNVSDLATEVADFPTTIEEAAATPAEVVTSVEDKSIPSTLNTGTTAPRVITSAPTTGAIQYEPETLLDQNTVKMGTIARIEDKVTSKSTSPAQVAVAGKMAPTAEVSSEQQVATVKKYLDNYTRLNTAHVTPYTTPSQSLAACRAFLGVAQYATTNAANPAVLQEVYVFFKNNRGGILDPLYALQGIQNLKKEDSMLAQIFYQVFYNATDPKRTPISMEVVRSVFGRNGDAVVNFIVAKVS